MLRWRKARREEPIGTAAEPRLVRDGGVDPEQDALLAESVGLALLVVLETLAPAELRSCSTTCSTFPTKRSLPS
jgi:RNA polymerase sigma-70 factor, ECF subfamily